jgi:hypothetical protein
MLVTLRKSIGVLSILAGSSLLALWLLAMSADGFVSTLLFGLPGLPLIGGLWLFGGILAGVGNWPGKTGHRRPPTSPPTGWRPAVPAPSLTGPYGAPQPRPQPRPQPASGADARSAQLQTNQYRPPRHLHSVPARWQSACTAHDAVTTALVVHPLPPEKPWQV